MDELIKTLQPMETVTPLVTFWTAVIGCALSGVLSILIGLTYRKVQGEATYSVTLVHTMVLLSMITAMIMVIIGSNIARAFSLVGALSVIRFRSAIKSPLDVGFLFFSMGIGMACGTRFYAVATAGTMIISSVMLLLKMFRFAALPARNEYLLSVLFYPDVKYEKLLDPILRQYFDAYSLAYVESVRQGTLREVVYSVSARDSASEQDILNEVAQINNNLKISFRSIRHAVEIP